MTFKIGDIIEGEVTGIQPYGAFVSLNGESQGLIHISEVKQGYIKNINEVLEVGMTVKVIVIDIDEYSQKISLSMRALEESHLPHDPYRKKRYFTNKYKNYGFEPLGKALVTWTEDALHELGVKKK